MIEEINISNYKSIEKLKFQPGRFNVIIGTNGCGKSNILEAITLASAAQQNKLDNELLLLRNIRVTDPQFMVNAFAESYSQPSKFISIDITGDEKQRFSRIILNYDTSQKQWMNVGEIIENEEIKHLVMGIFKEDKATDKETLHIIEKSLDSNKELIQSIREKIIDKPSLSSFLSYRPMEYFLREAKDSIIYPLGVHGEGLLQYLKKLLAETTNESESLIQEIKEGLYMLDWFDDVTIPENLLANEYKLSIGDKYLKDSTHFFDQRSTNEGFLYLLFLLTLFNSEETPAFFSVDNIEASFNPGLCVKLVKELNKATLKHNKQVILTTHNPFILDGLDLSDDSVRLFVARRDIDGHTRLERINYREDRKMNLSELWMSGLIGALPDNF